MPPSLALTNNLRKAHTPVQRALAICRYELKARTPSEWKAALLDIADLNVRTRVATIVWWDYFGARPFKRRWPHLDQYLRAPVPEVSRSALAAGLITVGYHPVLAHARVESS